MLRSRIIPCLLLRGGGLVKTTRFGNDKYVGDPINAVKIFNEKQVDELTLFDIDATAKGREPDYDGLKVISMESRMPLCYGGGVSSAAQASRIVALGFEKVSVSAAAVERPDLVREMADAIGRQSVVVTIDVQPRKFRGGYTVYTHNAKRKHSHDLLELVSKVAELGAGEIVINSIDRDGMMNGYDLALAKLVRAHVDLPLSFLGGAGSVDDMKRLVETVGTVGACAGSLFVFRGSLRAVLINYARPAAA